MDKFSIIGGTPLRGEVTPGGNKNAALPLLAACLLTREPIIFKKCTQHPGCTNDGFADAKPGCVD